MRSLSWLFVFSFKILSHKINLSLVQNTNPYRASLTQQVIEDNILQNLTTVFRPVAPYAMVAA